MKAPVRREYRKEQGYEIHADDACPGAGWERAGIGTWPQKDFKAHIQFMKRFGRELSEAGELAGAEGLASPEHAKVVRAGKNGAPEVTDGPFPEAKEFLAGYWIVDVESPRRAYEIATRVSAAPGRGGVPLNMVAARLAAEHR